MNHQRGALAIALICMMIACTRPSPDHAAPILLFAGKGTSPNDVKAVEAILKEQHLDYATANERDVNSMKDAQLKSYRLLIMPGGDFLDIGDGLLPGTLTKIHDAVQDGMNYLGLCAGAFLAGKGQYKSLNLTGVPFAFYEAEKRGIRKDALMITSAGAPPIQHYWEDGPELSGWGAVVAKYPDGTPAVVEGRSGKGWVILSGTHPEAPDNWRRGMTFTMPATLANAYAGALIQAALNGTELPHY